MAKKKQKLTIQARRRLFVEKIICLGVFVLLVIALVSKSLELYNLGKEKKQKEEEYAELQEKSEYLKNEIVKLHDPEYLAKFARENYSYSKDGELIIKIEKNDDDKKEIRAENNITKENEKIIFLCGLGIGLIFIYIIVRGIKAKKITD